MISAALAAKEIVTPRPEHAAQTLAQARLGVFQTALADALKCYRPI